MLAKVVLFYCWQESQVLHVPLNVLPEQVLQIQQVTLSDDQQGNVQYGQAALQWTLETTDQQKHNAASTGNALQSITTKLNEPLHIELMADGSMLPGGEPHGQRFIAHNESEILGPPLPRVCQYFISVSSAKLHV